MSDIKYSQACEAHEKFNDLVKQTRLIVLTGGPGAGKTAVLEIIRKRLCDHVVILPEAASIVYGGGFWRLESVTARTAAQKAILHVQKEMENLVLQEGRWTSGLCDRGIVDGIAYWPGDQSSFWDAAGLDLQAVYARYYSVIHLRSPTKENGYNHQNPLRTETARQAAEIDEKIATVWSAHPRYRVIESTADFLTKAQQAIACTMGDLPVCCRNGAGDRK